MEGYTYYLESRKSEIFPDDENYVDELIEVAESFRSFDSALDEFIFEHGYDNDPDDIERKIGYIRQKFMDSDISIESRIIKKWFTDHTRSTDRNIAFQFCFAFGLDYEETQQFFRKVYLQRGIDCHSVTEAIYYFAIRRGLSSL